MKNKSIVFFLVLIFIFSFCRKKHKQEEEINTIQPAKQEGEKLEVDKEKLKQLSITISLDSINKLLSYYDTDSSNNFFYTSDQLNYSLGFRDLFYSPISARFDIGKIDDAFANRYCLINFQQYNHYWSIYLLSQRFPKYEDGYYCGSIIHLLTFDSTNKFINAVQIMRNASDAMNDLIEWCNFKKMSDTSFSISIMKRYFDSFDSDHVKDYWRTFDSVQYTLLIDFKGHFMKKCVYNVHSFLELSEEDK